MINFSMKCKAQDLPNAMELAKTAEKGYELFKNGDTDEDWFSEFMGMLEESADRLGVSIRFGDPKIESEIL